MDLLISLTDTWLLFQKTTPMARHHNENHPVSESGGGQETRFLKETRFLSRGGVKAAIEGCCRSQTRV
ncbi:hypothetical protein SPLC1_S271020 [Arthrospira platensis C1]|uniref:Uncharacterized protein n=1 Tax=Limnospira indica PCC 8005 TaxID=376219 RepID=A0A9P1KK25_9CYAN|nr:hypothetical protein SPLC1_S271020 [Arthrospira platensis C1]MDT9232867.1 hypothetical protein [Limnospira sp. PMC 917.15]CDM97053.1 conserved protein of unknown function [Limnospira indica PCC 8005]